VPASVHLLWVVRNLTQRTMRDWHRTTRDAVSDPLRRPPRSRSGTEVIELEPREADVKPRILVVDDQPDIRLLLRNVLQRRSYDVVTAEGGPEALEILKFDAMPDLILLDVQMPKMDGWDTLAAIRDAYAYEGPRIVMCTVKSHPRDLIRGWTSGCDGYIWKPFDMRRLTDEIEEVLKRGYTERAQVRRTAIGEAQMLLRQIS
jgi:DNA-binding response OmpR family regulator